MRSKLLIFAAEYYLTIAKHHYFGVYQAHAVALDLEMDVAASIQNCVLRSEIFEIVHLVRYEYR